MTRLTDLTKMSDGDLVSSLSEVLDDIRSSYDISKQHLTSNLSLMQDLVDELEDRFILKPVLKSGAV